jgi:hypothetical protein
MAAAEHAPVPTPHPPQLEYTVSPACVSQPCTCCSADGICCPCMGATSPTLGVTHTLSCPARLSVLPLTLLMYMAVKPKTSMHAHTDGVSIPAPASQVVRPPCCFRASDDQLLQLHGCNCQSMSKVIGSSCTAIRTPLSTLNRPQQLSKLLCWIQVRTSMPRPPPSLCPLLHRNAQGAGRQPLTPHDASSSVAYGPTPLFLPTR